MTSSEEFNGAIARFGQSVTGKLANIAVAGEPEDQLRAPLEVLLADVARLCGFADGSVVAVGESSLSDLKTRPDYAVSVANALVGFIEVKAPGKGADPRRFRDRHDKEQWDKLKAIPNLLYTDGNAFSLWRNGQLEGEVVRLDGDVESSGKALRAPLSLLALFENFYRWQPVSPRSAKQLAEVTARLCRLLRDEVVEQLDLGSAPLTSLATDWRRLLFPTASDKDFADGYAQAVTFGLLVARARRLELRAGLDQVAKTLGRTDSLIGTALRLLTDDAGNQRTLQTSIGTLVRVLDAVDWSVISKGKPDAWLYFYEDFLEEYDNQLRKRTGSYYTPPQAVAAMLRLVNDVLKSRFSQPRGVAGSNVIIADPAVGTGTFLLGALRAIASEIEEAEGAGAVPAAMEAAVRRLFGFELQLGPYAVAQLRLVAELTELSGDVPHEPLRLFVTDTLANPWAEQEQLGQMYEPIAESRRRANQVKREQPITVVVGNPPYKEKAKGQGGWVESGGTNHPAPLLDWMPPAAWGVGAHAKHLRNLYVYFWRWATWKVFDAHQDESNGVVCFVTVAGFLNGPGFEKMRDWLRRRCQEIWIVDLSPEGHQPEVSSRVFEGVQQPICIMLASRSPNTSTDVPATVRYRAVAPGNRLDKFAELASVQLDDAGWTDCSSEWRAPFLPERSGEWAAFPALEDFFTYNGSGVMPGRTWVIAPDVTSLEQRWEALQRAKPEDKERLFHPHLVAGKPGDRSVHRVSQQGLAGQIARTVSVAADTNSVMRPVRYAFRSFDRQWIIPDYRLINRPNPSLWEWRSPSQVYLSALYRTSPISGPGVSLFSEIPDLDHYNGRGGRIFPLYTDASAATVCIPAGIRKRISGILGTVSTAENIFAYIAGIAASPAYTVRFQSDLVQPGLRIPLTADSVLFDEVVNLGRTIIWLHTFGERFADAAAGRPHGAPRVEPSRAPRYEREGTIPLNAEGMPDSLSYDLALRRLSIGSGFIDNVAPEVWAYEVSGKQILKQWFSYRRRSRERPIIGDRRPPSPLGDIQPDKWLPEYTTDLIDLLHVLTWLVTLEDEQRMLLERVCAGPFISAADIATAKSEHVSNNNVSPSPDDEQHGLFS